MTTGNPDYTQNVKIIGKDPSGNPVAVALDASGRIIATIYGAIDAITNPVAVDQNEKDREIKGADGTTLRTVVVDSNGQLIMVPRGQSGNYMAVDANGFLAALMKGEYDGSPVTVALDADGNIVSVMKGEYAGALKTLATDADGRILATITDPENIWGIRPAIGNAELAARLGAPARWDRRGSVVMQDSFEGGMNRAKISSSYGSSYQAVITAERACSGGYSLKLVPGTSENDLVAVTEYAVFPKYTGLAGFEAHFAVADNEGTVFVSFWVYTGSLFIDSAVKIDLANSHVYYLDSTDNWVDTGEQIGGTGLDYIWHGVKIVLDLTNHNYVRILADDNQIDMSGISNATSSNTSTPQVGGKVYVTTPASGVPPVLYVDDLIYTINEPT